mmetsp:Transcript_14729/g.20471  ORF Transcript_14729/g.20471 Transcript_14729/m.20471 type:complete len:122 (-) Transcript_14729:251-616(-)
MNQEGRDVFEFLKKQQDEETFGGKMVRKFKQDPLVPTFFGLTCCALLGGLRAMGKGDSKNSNRFMRARVIAQGCCLAALAYAGFRGRLIVDQEGKRSPGAGGDFPAGQRMPPGIPPPPPGK